MKRKTPFLLLAIALVLALSLTLVACGEKDNAETGKEQTETVKELTADGGVTVSGEFDKGATLEVKTEKTDGENGKAALSKIADKTYDETKVAVFDISVMKDGAKVQPSGKVKVTMQKPFDSESGYVTYHIKEDSAVEELATTLDGDKISFETESFSYFIVAGAVNPDEPHLHVYTEKVTENNLVDAATCTRKAVYRLVCKTCGELGRETFEYGELAEHDLRDVKGYDARCEETGLTHGKKCFNAGCTYTDQTEIPATGHEMRDIEAKAPTCTESGYKAYKRCVNGCGKTEGYEELAATGHNMQTVPRKEPTCTEWGYEEHEECANDGCKENFDYKLLRSLGHDYVTHPMTYPTCTEDGNWKEYKTCTRCDYTSNTESNIWKATGHQYLEHHEGKEPDCLPGYDEYDTCKRVGCDYTTKVEIPANGKHSFVCDVCITCGENNPVKYTRDGNYIYFGYWMQTCEKDETITAKLLEIAGNYPDYPYYENPNNWLNHEGAEWIWYKDVIYNGVKYRGIKLKDFRTVGSVNCYSWQYRNGYSNGQAYWFRFEPIKWRILTATSTSAFLMSEFSLDFNKLQLNYEYVNNNGIMEYFNTDEGVPENTYANNWEYTFIRKWLNDTFYNTVFNDLQKEIVRTTLVDNSARSANLSNNSTYYNNGENRYADQCNNTYDKVFLLSLQDITNKAYGFSESIGTDSARKIESTDYAKFQGQPSLDWFTRSPSFEGNKGLATYYVYRYGTSGDYYGQIAQMNASPGGIVPALWITLDSAE